MTIKEVHDLSQAYQSEFWSFALSLTRDQDRAMDLLQEVHYRVLKSRNTFQRGTDFRAWFKRIIRNVFISDYRRQSRRARILSQNALPSIWHQGVTEVNSGVRRLEEEEINSLISQLPNTSRYAFLMYLQGMSYKEIAQRSRVPEGTVKSRIFAAKKSLRKLVRQQDMLA